MSEPPIIVHTAGDGEIVDESAAELRTRLDDVLRANNVVVHLHGGLISVKHAQARAERLAPFYRNAGAIPLFVTWETGITETFRNNAGEIAEDEFFKRILEKLASFVSRKLLGTESASTDMHVLANVIGLRGVVTPATSEELTAFEQELKRDEFRNPTLDALQRSRLVSPAFAESAKQESSAAWLPIVVRAAQCLARVCARFAAGRDHGLHATCVEELLRAFYLDNFGKLLWRLIKNDAAQSMMPGRGGAVLAAAIAAAPRSPSRRLTIVGHSAGSIYACHLLDEIARGAPRDGSQANACVDGLVLLAPAVTHALFHRTMVQSGELVRNFRCYNLRDRLEAGYWEIPVLYSRSLLYMVAGLAETDDRGIDAVDQPLLGMERYLARRDVYRAPELEWARAWLAQNDRLVFSDDPARGLGLHADAVTHGTMDDTPTTETPKSAAMQSVAHLLRDGWGPGRERTWDVVNESAPARFSEPLARIASPPRPRPTRELQSLNGLDAPAEPGITPPARPLRPISIVDSTPGFPGAPAPGANHHRVIPRSAMLDRELAPNLVLESILGVDERSRIEQTTHAPWRMICSLEIRGPNGSAIGTGWLAGRRTVITAGHCVFDPVGLGGWASEIVVRPGRDGASAPFSAFRCTRFETTSAWANALSPDHDFGVILIDPEDDPSDVSTRTGWLPVAVLDDASIADAIVNVSGYPEDKASGTTQWHHAKRVVRVTDHRVFYDADTVAGESGAPVFVDDGSGPLVIGIHAYGVGGAAHLGIEANSGPRITGAVLDLLRAWIDAGARSSITN